jgi:hypothetical protein
LSSQVDFDCWQTLKMIPLFLASSENNMYTFQNSILTSNELFLYKWTKQKSEYRKKKIQAQQSDCLKNCAQRAIFCEIGYLLHT